MQSIKHRNCVEYFNCYLRQQDHIAWVSLSLDSLVSGLLAEGHRQARSHNFFSFWGTREFLGEQRTNLGEAAVYVV